MENAANGNEAAYTDDEDEEKYPEMNDANSSFRIMVVTIFDIFFYSVCEFGFFFHLKTHVISQI